ncbi:MAG: DUF6371 domain-containing protein [Flavisolibacter sp.]
MNYRFQLQPYKTPASRLTCPSCGAKREFAPYIDTTTGEILAAHVGRCNRELNCGYHYKPEQFFSEVGRSFTPHQPKHLPEPPKVEPSFVSGSLVEQSMKNWKCNNLFQWMANLFGEKPVFDLSLEYFVGTAKHWPGATVFWQTDRIGNFRGGKIMLYDPETGKRTRNPDHVTWVHRVAKLNDYNLVQCFFGEHLITEYPDKTIAVVESEKTALICSLHYPEYVWIATGGKNGCRWHLKDVSNVLAGRRVIFFPDSDAFDVWSAKVSELMKTVDADLRISDFIDSKLSESEKSNGLDLADMLLSNWCKVGQFGANCTTLHQPAPVGQGAGGI